ncbi:hypothetical protein [Paracoccus cavernae]|uniref:hypothetical protein n=1 Tax=Paracoccus cavernae TaxID=1571207 RepID=UPI00362EF58B
MGARVRFHQNLALAGRLPGRQLDFVRAQPATKIEAEALQLPVGASIYVAEGSRPPMTSRSRCSARSFPPSVSRDLMPSCGGFLR